MRSLLVLSCMKDTHVRMHELAASCRHVGAEEAKELMNTPVRMTHAFLSDPLSAALDASIHHASIDVPDAKVRESVVIIYPAYLFYYFVVAE